MFNVVWFNKFLIAQGCITLVITLGFGIEKGLEAGVSALMGGSIAILPSLVFARMFFTVETIQHFKTEPSSFFKVRRLQSAKQVLLRFYLAEVLKLLMTAILFTLAFQWSRLRPVSLLLAFAATYAGYWLLPWMTRKP